MFGIKKGILSGGFVGLLDLYPNAETAWSLELLRRDYSGGLIRCLAYDGSEHGRADIMPIRIGSQYILNMDSKLENLDATAIGRGLTTSDTLGDLVDSGSNNYDGVIPSLYDQKNSSDLSNSTIMQMPQIVSSGSLIEDSGKASINFNLVNQQYLSNSGIFGGNYPSNFSVFSVAYLFSTAENQGLYGAINSGGGSALSSVYYVNRNSRPGRVDVGISDNPDFRVIATDSAQTITSEHLFTQIYSGGTDIEQHINGGSSLPNATVFSSGSANTNGGTEQEFALGRLGCFNGFYLSGRVKELVIFSNDQTSNQTGIESNIKDRYGL